MAVTGTLSGPVLRDGLDATRESIGRAHHLPGYIYTSPEIFQLEKDKDLHEGLAVHGQARVKSRIRATT